MYPFHRFDGMGDPSDLHMEMFAPTTLGLCVLYVHVFLGLPKIIPCGLCHWAIFMCYCEASLEFFNKFGCQIKYQIVLDRLSIRVNF